MAGLKASKLPIVALHETVYMKKRAKKESLEEKEETDKVRLRKEAGLTLFLLDW